MKNDEENQSVKPSSSPPEIVVYDPQEVPDDQSTTPDVDPLTRPDWMEKLNQISAVASSPQYKNFLVIGVLFLTGLACYYIFFLRTPTVQEVEKKNTQTLQQKLDQVVKTSSPVATAPTSKPLQMTPAPNIPAPTALPEPAPPEPPMAPMPQVPAAIFKPQAKPKALTLPKMDVSLPDDLPKASNPSISFLTTSKEQKEAERKDKIAKRSAPSLVYGGNKSKADVSVGTSNTSTEKKTSNSDFLGFSNGSLEKPVVTQKTSAAQITATTVGNLNNMMLQGKMMSAVLETAIDTTLEGKLRAIITNNVYAESGKRILIPQGSKIIGSYDSNVSASQSRIKITWSRLIRPDGIDIAISAIGSDGLGRAGVFAKSDSKIMEQMAAAFLVSYIIPAVTSKIANSSSNALTVSTTTSGTNTTSTTTGSPSTVDAGSAINQFSAIATNLVNSAYSTKPTLTVPQGTIITILVNSDILFASEESMRTDKVLR